MPRRRRAETIEVVPDIEIKQEPIEGPVDPDDLQLVLAAVSSVNAAGAAQAVVIEAAPPELCELQPLGQSRPGVSVPAGSAELSLAAADVCSLQLQTGLDPGENLIPVPAESSDPTLANPDPEADPDDPDVTPADPSGDAPRSRRRAAASGTTPWHCSGCRLSLPSSTAYDEHMIKHERDFGRRCYICRKILRGALADFQTHLKLHSSVKKFKCHLCDKSFVIKKYLSRHMYLSHRPELPHKCPVCGKGFKFACKMRMHHMTHTGEKPLKCRYCEKTFLAPFSLQCHERVHTGQRPYKCGWADCTYACRDGSSLRTHIKLKHKKEKNRKCPHCDAMFDKPSDVRDHVRRMHEGEKTIKCDECDKMFFDRAAMLRHKAVHSDERPFTCELCPKKSFKTIYYLKLHELTHTRKPTFKCTVCDKTFKFNHYLTKHMQIHNDKDKFKCECGKRFKSLRYLRRHAAQHQRGKPFSCPYCNKRFVSAKSAAYHRRRFHTRIPCMWCLQCGTEFRRVANLVDHYYALHRDEGPFNCPDCGHVFKRVRSFARHRAEMHMTYVTDGQPLELDDQGEADEEGL